MSSPQGSKPPPTTPSSKDSPTSNIFNNLSPINVISSRLSCQAFDNVDVPSPQPVFATPQNRLINSKLWKRSQTLFFPRSQKICPGDADLAATSLEYPGMTRQFIPMAAAPSSNGSDMKYNNDHNPQNEVCRSLSNGVDEFLSIPSEDCENTSCSPGFFLGEADDLVQDKENIPFSSNGDQMAYPNEDSAQVPAIKSSTTVTNSVAKYAQHSELVSTINMQPNEVAPSKAFQNNSTVFEVSDKDSLVSNAEEISNLNVIDQNSTCQPEKDPAKEKPSSKIVSAAFEEIEKKGGLLGKKVEVKSKSLVDSISSIQIEPIPPDREASSYPRVPNTMNFRGMGHINECPGTSGSYLLRMQDVDLYSSSIEYLGKLGRIYEEKCEMLRNTQFHTNHHGISSQMRNASGKNQIPHDQEDLAHHSRGMYKRLQFDDVENQKHSIADTRNGMNLKSPCFMPETAMIASNTESSHASTANTITMSGRIQTFQSLSGNISCNFLVKTDTSEQSKGRFTAVVPRSSGIGLHLNAIGMTAQMSSHIDMKLPVEGLGVEGKTFFGSSCEVPSQGLKNMMVSRNEAGEVSVQLVSNSDDSSFGSMGECNIESHQKSLDSAADYHSPLDVEPLDMCMQPEFTDHHITPCSRKRPPCLKASKSEDSAQTSLGKKRKKDPEIEGQKRCNCKRSKCLKLYCDCFAAGIFCNNTCACQGCSNNSENEEMVCSTRQLIETRNPLAFAPKVVLANGDLKESADNKHITPPSARHKRGCNCKKSKCLKKYCECYQAGVGCSFGCRCEGCKNVYGTKEAYGDITEIVVEHQKPVDGLNGESSVEAMDVNDKEYNTKKSNTRFTIPAPLAQDSNVNSVAGSQLPASYHPASESNFDELSPLESPNSIMNHTRNSANGGKSEETSSIIPYDQQFDSSSGLNADPLTPGWNGFPDICNISPLSGPSPSNLRTEHAKSYYAKLFSGRDTLSGASFRQCSNATKGRFGDGKFITTPATGGPNYNLVDETPEILMDAHSPIRTVKASSPNQKRVSPPNKMLHEGGSSFSPGLKSGRKYVLHSIPQFPSLTPYRNNSKNKSFIRENN